MSSAKEPCEWGGTPPLCQLVCCARKILLHKCDMRIRLCCDSRNRAFTLIGFVRGCSFICVTWLFHMCDMTLLYVWHDSFICVTWLFYMCDMTLSNVWHDSFICVTWLFRMCDMTPSYVWHDSCFIHMTPSCVRICSHVWHDSFTLESHDSSIRMTWLLVYIWGGYDE